jgi:hypothetical protein
MTANIASTITTAVPAAVGYSNYVEQAVAALTEREYQLSDLIATEVSQHLLVDKAQVEERLTGIGMAVRPAPEPEPEIQALDDSFDQDDEETLEAPAGQGKKGKRVKALEEKVDKLASAVSELAALAERHLGARR